MKSLPALLSASTALLASVAAMAAPAPALRSSPNIIFILCDDLGWGDVGVFYQNSRQAAHLPAELTPCLDRMAAQGARFTSQYSAAPVCAPSRASILLGVDQGHANVRNNEFDKALEDNHNLATVLHQAGYATAAIGKWGLGGRGEGDPMRWPAHPLVRGFDYYYGYLRHRDGHQHYPKEAPWAEKGPGPEGRVDPSGGPGPGKQVWDDYQEVSAGLDKCYTADLFAARAKQWIVDEQSHQPGKPFFLYLAFDTPHAVLEYPTQAYPAGGGLHGGLQWLGQPGHMINTASGKVDSYSYPEYVAAKYADVYQRYASSVRRIDDCVGDLLTLLKDLHIDDNTLVVFTSDNGPANEGAPVRNSPQFFGSFGPYDGIKRDCWEGGMREPTIVRWPGHVTPNKVIDFPSALWDWMPTFAEVAGLPSPARADGVSLMPSLTGNGTQRDRGFLYFEYNFHGRTPNYPEFEPSHRARWRNQMQALRVGDIMAVRYDIKTPHDAFEIYDVAHDLKEAHNLASDQAYAGWQARLEAQTLQSRRPDAEAPRPYDKELMPASPLAHSVAGLHWKRFPGKFPWVPDLDGLTPAAEGEATAINLTGVAPAKGSAVAFEGSLQVPADGDYTFYLSADGGAFLRIHEASVVDADYGYTGGQVRSGKVRLKAGPHPYRLYYLHRPGVTPALDWQWEGPGITHSPIPAEDLQHAAAN